MTDQFAYQNANQDLVSQSQPYGCFDYNNQGYMNFQNPNPSNFTPNTNSNWNQNQSSNFNQNADCYQNFNTSQFSSQQTLPNVTQFNNYPPVQNNFSLSNSGFNNMQSTNLPLDNFNQNIYQENPRGGSSNYKGAPGNNRNSGQNFNKGGKRGGYSNSGMEEQHDTIFVSGLPENTTEVQLQEYFGSIGLIKIDKKTGKPKIWIYRDKESQKPKGEVTITYDDPPTAKSAINWFDGKDFYGSIIKVELAQRKNNYLNTGKSFGNRDNSNRNSGRDYDKSSNNDRSSGNGGREGDWLCPNPSCKNNNFAWRTSCNRCKTDKPSSKGGSGGGSSNFSSGRNDDRRSGNMPPFERRNNMSGPQSGRRDGPKSNNSFNRGGRSGGQQGGDRSFNKYGGNRDQRGGGRNGGSNSGGRSGGPMRGSDNKRLVPY